MVDLTLALAGCASVAALAGAIGAVMPPTLRPWWHARRNFIAPVPMPGSLRALAPTLQVVITVDRRRQQLPFVGQDRRKARSASTGAHDRHRHGNGE